MKLIKIFLLILILLALVFFLTLNGEKTSVDLIFAQYSTFLFVVILISGGIGLLLGFLLAVSSVISAKNTTRQLRSKNKKLTDELNQLRNVNIEEESLSVETENEA